MEHTLNSAAVRGTFGELPVFSHENHGRKFYRFSLKVPRLSGIIDTIPVITEERILDEEIAEGDMITVTGQVRSHNVRDGAVRHLMIFIFADSITAETGEPLNQITLEGPICREPIYRHTPLGREICDMMLAVPRAFHRADYLPCILWGRIAEEASFHHTRDIVHIEGRLQSRIYTKNTDSGPEERTAYEVSALTAGFLEDSED